MGGCGVWNPTKKQHIFHYLQNYIKKTVYKDID